MATPALITWGVIVLLILVNALYVAAEFSAVGARRSRIRQLAGRGHRAARRLLPVVDDPRALDRYIAASQIGITLSSLLLGAWAQVTLAPALAPVLASWAERWTLPWSLTGPALAAGVVLVGLAAAQVIVGELVPKALALQYPARVALATVVPTTWSLRAFAWFIAVLNGSGLALLRLLGLRASGHRHVHSPEEIELLVAESRDGGLLEPEEEARLQRALRLRQRCARDLMVPRDRVATVQASEPIDRVVEQVATSPYTRLVVVETSLDRPIGVLHTKDLVAAWVSGERPGLRSLVRPVVRVRDDTPADRLLSALREARTPIALVVDRSDRVVGLVTLEDVASELLGAAGRARADAPAPARATPGA